MGRPRGIGAALRLGAEAAIMAEERMAVAHLGAEIFTMTERRLVAFHLDADFFTMTRSERLLRIWMPKFLL